ncbi:MAG: GNAT family N-acetyltransferase [Bacteroidia bacterium]|nr:GNAT family N-acetyltransferase [Bacteroidia bacterium]
MQINTAVFEKFPILKTGRLTLRDIRPEDAEQIFLMRSSGRVNQFIARPAMSNVEDSLKLAEKTRLAYSNKQGIGWAGILRDSQIIIGTCGYNQIDFANLRAEIGGELAVDYWGKNVAIEAVSAIIKFGLDTMNLHSIEAKVSPQNRGAIFLLEQIGFKKEAHFCDRIYFNKQFADMAVYTLIKGNETFGV